MAKKATDPALDGQTKQTPSGDSNNNGENQNSGDQNKGLGESQDDQSKLGDGIPNEGAEGASSVQTAQGEQKPKVPAPSMKPNVPAQPQKRTDEPPFVNEVKEVSMPTERVKLSDKIEKDLPIGKTITQFFAPGGDHSHASAQIFVELEEENDYNRDLRKMVVVKPKKIIKMKPSYWQNLHMVDGVPTDPQKLVAYEVNGEQYAFND